MATRIALSGPPKAGKSTLARYLRDEYGYTYISLSAYIEEAYTNSFVNLTEKDIQAGRIDIKENKENYRRELQSMGDTLGMNDERVLDIMIAVLHKAGIWNWPTRPVVMEAIRGPKQAAAARKLGFIIANIGITVEEQRARSHSFLEFSKLMEASQARPDLESGYAGAEIHLPYVNQNNIAQQAGIVARAKGDSDVSYQTLLSQFK